MKDILQVGTREHGECSNKGKKESNHKATITNSLIIKKATIENTKEKEKKRFVYATLKTNMVMGIRV